MLRNECKVIDEKDLDEKSKEQEKRNIKKYLYIGESARSVYERLWEHQHSLEQLSPDSHMLKHIVEVHPGENISDVKFHARVLKYAKSAFERQITESVLIQEYRESNHILNSKSEYNRCSIPRLTTKMGEKEIKEWEKTRQKSKKEESEQEAEIKRKIYEIRKEKMKSRRCGENDNLPQKRRN